MTVEQQSGTSKAGQGKQVFVVDDEVTLCNLMDEALSAAGYKVETANSVKQAKQVMGASSFDVVILDIMMPSENGFDFLRWMRKDRKDLTPVMLLTGVSAEQDKLLAFELGADDYIVKPFSMPEVIARIKAVLRRAESKLPQHLFFGDCHIDRAARMVHRNGEEVKLRLKEYQVLLTLAESPGVAISRQELFKAIWGDDSPSGEKTVDVTIHTLREKVEQDAAAPEFIQTVRGFGYRFTPPQDASAKA